MVRPMKILISSFKNKYNTTISIIDMVRPTPAKRKKVATVLGLFLNLLNKLNIIRFASINFLASLQVASVENRVSYLVHRLGNLIQKGYDAVFQI